MSRLCDGVFGLEDERPHIPRHTLAPALGAPGGGVARAPAAARIGYHEAMGRRYAHLKPAEQVGQRTWWRLKRDARELGWDELWALERHWREDHHGTAWQAALTRERKLRHKRRMRRYWRNASERVRLRHLRRVARYRRSKVACSWYGGECPSSLP